MRAIAFDRLGLLLLMVSPAGALAGCGATGFEDSTLGETASASSGGDPAPLGQVAVPQPVGGDIINATAAIRLGKALFWEQQTGSDGLTACASCHFHAGVDNRRLNTVNPGFNRTFDSVAAPGQLFNGASITTDDVVGSQGVVKADFTAIDPDPNVAADQCVADPTGPFGTNRQVTARNAPTVVGAVFFRDNFWDGRANHVFNGFDPFGNTGNAAKNFVTIANASLASQADGPPTNDVEMSCARRQFNDANSLATKLLARPALKLQMVDPTDGVLGALSASPNPGLVCSGHPCSYQELINAAFSATLASLSQTQFSRIWGQAIQAYEATLIPSDTPLDRYLAGNSNAMTGSQQRGFDRFKGKGNCTKCHAGSELSDATVGFATAQGLINEDGGDQGFHNLGVRPTAEDIGRAGLGPKGVSFSVSGSNFDHGAFKTAALRNVKLTAPYFHNGGKATLTDVVNFYNQGGDFANPEKANRIKPLSFDAQDIAAVVDFLTNALTDCRTEKERAPFDHPSLVVPNGTSLPAVGAAGTGACP